MSEEFKELQEPQAPTEPAPQPPEKPEASEEAPPKRTLVIPDWAKQLFTPHSMFRLVFTLMLITAVVALLLGFVNKLTAPRIEEHRIQAAEKAMRAVVAADTYKALSERFYEARVDGKLIGFAVSVAPAGYGGPISLMVGVDLQGRVTGVSVVKQSETPGLGSRANEPGFLGQFIGKDASLRLGVDIDALSGATITSKAVTAGVQEAIAKVLQYLNGEGGTP